MKEINEIAELLTDLQLGNETDFNRVEEAKDKLYSLKLYTNEQLLSHIGKAFDAARETEENEPWCLPIMKYKSKSDYIKELGL